MEEAIAEVLTNDLLEITDLLLVFFFIGVDYLIFYKFWLEVSFQIRQF